MPLGDRAEVTAVAKNVFRIILRFGFMDNLSIPEGMHRALAHPLLRDINSEELSYYFGHETVIATERLPGMARWREVLFGFMQRNAERKAAYFCVPTEQVIEVGIEIEI